MPEIPLPPLDESTATVERYYVQPGATVRRGQPLAVVVTSRFEWELPADAEGVVAEIVAPPGTAVTTGQALVRLTGAEARPAATDGQVARATPLARRIARVHGLDLAGVTGSGPGGRITRGDVLQRLPATARAAVHAPDVACFTPPLPDALAISAPPPAGSHAPTPAIPAPPARPEAPRQPLHEPQRRMAEAVLRREALPYALQAVEVDLSRALAWIAARRAQRPRRAGDLTPLACVAWAAAQTLLRHRLVNSLWSEEGVIVRGRIRLAVVRADGRSALIEDAPDLSAQGLARRLATAEDQPIDAASFTIYEAASARWSALPPGLGGGPALSLGAIAPRARVIDAPHGQTIAARPCALLTLTYDARVLTPPQADAFLVELQRRLELFDGLC